MPHFREKSMIEARQYDGRNGIQLLRWVGGSELEEEFTGDAIQIVTVANVLVVDKDDWIIKDRGGLFSSCKADVFTATYEPA